MRNLSEAVKPDGTLDDSRIWKREPLYQGMNGRWVERFYIERERSYIFKPVTNGENADREVWVYRNVLDRFPEVYPKLLAASPKGKGLDGWTVFEDLGSLRHEYRLEYALRVAKLMAWWQARPAADWPGLSTHGLKPGIETIAGDLLERRGEARAVLERLGLPDRIYGEIRAVRDGSYFSVNKLVLSHGDLHLGNYAVTEGRLYLLDWEHAHLNLPYWDLFHLIDMSHPLFAKPMTSADRERILGEYLRRAEQQGTAWQRTALFREYGCFAALFSLWMMLLIQGDLRRGDSVWPRGGLVRQWDEAAANLAGCLALLETYRSDR